MSTRRVFPVRGSGFTLVEVIVVVAVLAIVVAIALPSLENARKTAFEGRAVGMLKTYSTANQQYRVRFGSYAGSSADLLNSDYLHHDPNAGVNGYAYSYVSSPPGWSVTATPDVPGSTGDRFFFVDHTNVLRYEALGPAGSGSLPLD